MSTINTLPFVLPATPEQSRMLYHKSQQATGASPSCPRKGNRVHWVPGVLSSDSSASTRSSAPAAIAGGGPGLRKKRSTHDGAVALPRVESDPALIQYIGRLTRFYDHYAPGKKSKEDREDMLYDEGPLPANAAAMIVQVAAIAAANEMPPDAAASALAAALGQGALPRLKIL